METDKENYLNKMKELSSIPEPFVRQSDDTDTWKEWDKWFDKTEIARDFRDVRVTEFILNEAPKID